MLNINDLNVELEEENKKILNGVNLEIKPGEVHAIMGPNGSGKSTLSYVLSGKDGYNVTEGTVSLEGEDVLSMESYERAALGMFLAFQYPVEIPGVGNMTFLRTALNSQRKANGIKQEDNAENNMFFQKPWSDVSDSDIVTLSNRLSEEIGGWVFHSPVDFSKPTPHLTIERSQPNADALHADFLSSPAMPY